MSESARCLDSLPHLSWANSQDPTVCNVSSGWSSFFIDFPFVQTRSRVPCLAPTTPGVLLDLHARFREEEEGGCWEDGGGEREEGSWGRWWRGKRKGCGREDNVERRVVGCVEEEGVGGREGWKNLSKERDI